MELRISVIIPVYNGAKVIGKVLQALQNSDFDFFEIIIVDDCSTDKTAEIVNQFSVKYIKLPEQSGPGAARNAGAKKAQASILFFLDADVILLPSSLSQVYKSLTQSEQKIGAVVGRYSTIPANNTWFANYLALFKNFTFLDKKDSTFSFFTGAMGGITKKLFWGVGGFTQAYRGADVEDYEFGYRIIQQGYQIVLNTNIVGRHHFPTFSKALKNYYRRTKLWMQLFLKRKKFDTGAASKDRGMLGLIAIGMVFSLVLSSLYLPFIIIFFILLSLFCILNFKFLIYCKKQRNFIFMIYVFGVSFAVYLTVGLAAIQVLLFNFIKK